MQGWGSLVLLACGPPATEQGRLDASVLDEVKKATSPDVHHATGKQPSSWRQGIVVGRASTGYPWPACTQACKVTRAHLVVVLAGVEVSPGVFKDVPGEVAARTEYVYAHTPGKAPRKLLAARSCCHACMCTAFASRAAGALRRPPDATKKPRRPCGLQFPSHQRRSG